MLMRWLCLFSSILLLNGCSDREEGPDVSQINLKLSAKRFERDLFGIDAQQPGPGIRELKNKYGNFFDLFAYKITSLGSRDSVQTVNNFRSFLSDVNFRNIYNDCEKNFGDFSVYETELTNAFRHYLYYFPGKPVPELVTLISGFSFPVICDSSVLGISLDMYMGPSYYYYSTLEPPLPNYLRSRMRKEFLVCDAMKGWALSDYGIDESTARMVDFMISQGRILVYLNQVLPETPDTIKTGYTAEQLDWCVANEGRIWSFFIDNKLLFSVDPNLMNKYVNDGPTTNGFPKESPGNIGQFIGWQIVKSYMKAHPAITLQQLMEQKDLMKIFNESNYKPRK
jgi:hypothetical protein